MSHPYIGLRATAFKPGHCYYAEGTIAAVGQGGSTNEESCAYVAVLLLLDDGSHTERSMEVVTVDPVEAKARLMRAVSL